MTVLVRVYPGGWASKFNRDQIVRVGRARNSDVRVGHELIQGRWTVSKYHFEVRWDGTRWSSLNTSDKPGLLQVYEPGYEPVLLEPGRQWVPVRHRWCYDVGHPDHPFHVVCHTDDHKGPAILWGQGEPASGTTSADEEETALFEGVAALSFTLLERDVLLAYYSDFALLPRPPTLGPRSHKEAARRLGRSQDSARKAIERVNEKISTISEAPAIATGRNVSGEIGRWLARTGILDPDLLDSLPRDGNTQ
ncbi:MAG TPA: hypothetical protein VMF65_07750 [Acidimicrobiales bacterium]|nr:hypothetical protein [Acidimicrobiales bacterium]